MNRSLKEIYLKIDELYVYLINEGENKNRDIFSFTHRLLNDLGDMSSSSNVIIDDNYILRLSKIVENLEIYHKQHSDVYDTNVWHYCKIRLAEINQLNKIRLKNIL